MPDHIFHAFFFLPQFLQVIAVYDLTRGMWESKTYSGKVEIKGKNVEVCSIVLVEEVGGAAVAEELAGRSWLERRPPPDGTNQTPLLHFGLSQTKRGDLRILKRGPKGKRESRFV